MSWWAGVSSIGAAVGLSVAEAVASSGAVAAGGGEAVGSVAGAVASRVEMPPQAKVIRAVQTRRSIFRLFIVFSFSFKVKIRAG
jgi:hypothetical protein